MSGNSFAPYGSTGSPIGLSGMAAYDPRQGVLSVARVLTDAEVKALNTTPIQLIPAPGIGKMIVPVSGQVISTQNNVAPLWTNARDATIRYAGSGSILANGPTISILLLGNRMAATSMLNPTGSVDNRNRAVEIVNLSSTAGPAGTTVAGTMIQFNYQIVTTP